MNSCVSFFRNVISPFSVTGRFSSEYVRVKNRADSASLNSCCNLKDQSALLLCLHAPHLPQGTCMRCQLCCPLGSLIDIGLGHCIVYILKKGAQRLPFG